MVKRIAKNVAIGVDIIGLLVVFSLILIKLDILSERYDLCAKITFLVIVILQIVFSIMRIHQRKCNKNNGC